MSLGEAKASLKNENVMSAWANICLWPLCRSQCQNSMCFSPESHLNNIFKEVYYSVPIQAKVMSALFGNEAISLILKSTKNIAVCVNVPLLSVWRQMAQLHECKLLFMTKRVMRQTQCDACHKCYPRKLPANFQNSFNTDKIFKEMYFALVRSEMGCFVLALVICFWVKSS